MAGTRSIFSLDCDGEHEQFLAVALDRAGLPLAERRFCTGHRDRVTPRFRDIAAMALECDAYALAVAHTHPSGDPAPSSADIDATRRLARLCLDLDIHFADHVIVARDGRFSFREAGII